MTTVFVLAISAISLVLAVLFVLAAIEEVWRFFFD